MSQSIGMVSLGCAKNQVDAEQMLFLLQQAGFEIHAEPAGSDVVIINTCGFIESAKTEAIDNILAMAALKAEGSIGKILVTGCLAQRYQQEILKELPEVDGVLGTGSYYDVVGAVKQLLAGREGLEEYGDIQAPVQECGRILTTPRQYAYLKIAEGCDNHCAFCIIPALRGRYRSRPMEKLIEEAKELAAGGAKELIVVAQDFGTRRWTSFRKWTARSTSFCTRSWTAERLTTSSSKKQPMRLCAAGIAGRTSGMGCAATVRGWIWRKWNESIDRHGQPRLRQKSGGRGTDAVSAPAGRI